MDDMEIRLDNNKDLWNSIDNTIMQHLAIGVVTPRGDYDEYKELTRNIEKFNGGYMLDQPGSDIEPNKVIVRYIGVNNTNENYYVDHVSDSYSILFFCIIGVGVAIDRRGHVITSTPTTTGDDDIEEYIERIQDTRSKLQSVLNNTNYGSYTIKLFSFVDEIHYKWR